MQNVTEAIEEVNLIKKVIDRTQNDFSRIANFFISIGVINTVTCLLYVTLFQIIKRMDHVGYTVWMLFRGLNYISVLGYVVLFFIYQHKLKNRNNALSLSTINIWGDAPDWRRGFPHILFGCKFWETGCLFLSKDFNIPFSSDRLFSLRFCDTG